MKMRWRTYCCGIVLAVSISLGLLSGSISRVYAYDSNPGVLPPHSDALGMTYGEWSATWWKWIFSLPVDQNPLFDGSDCSNGANGQHGPVWYLGGTSFAAPAVIRNCTVSTGRVFITPIIDVECSVIEGDGSTEAELRDCAASIMDLVINVEAEIDGVPIQNLRDYRVSSPLFTIGPLPPDNVLQYFGVHAPAGATSQAVADGYWLMLAPLQ